MTRLAILAILCATLAGCDTGSCADVSGHYLAPSICTVYRDAPALSVETTKGPTVAVDESEPTTLHAVPAEHTSKVRDRYGIVRGYIVTRPDGQVVIEDAHHIRRGYVEPAH